MRRYLLAAFAVVVVMTLLFVGGTGASQFVGSGGADVLIDGYTQTGASFGSVLTTVNPRIARLGVRWSF